MLFWILAIAITGLACAALLYASARRPVNASPGSDAAREHHRRLLAEIEQDVSAGRLMPAEATAAKSELAREVLRLEAETGGKTGSARLPETMVMPLAALAVAIVGFATYGVLGNPAVPSQPLAAREQPNEDIDLTAAVQEIEARLAQTPDDVRGWKVIAPYYRDTGRYPDLVVALRNVDRLEGPTADTRTDLAEALMLAEGGAGEEAIALLQDAAVRDAEHVRSRFYLAAEATERGDFTSAKTLWQELLALANGDEPWAETARGGLAAAEAGLAGTGPDAGGDAEQAAAIQSMVAELAARLEREGGSLAEWTQLVRSQLVLGDTAAAQAAYTAAKAAYPQPADRAELDALAASAGLT